MTPPIVAYHVTFAAYGFWLPNDPRGSWSKTVWAPQLRRFGPPIAAGTRRSLAAVPHDHARRQTAKAALLHAPVRFTPTQIDCIGTSIGDVAASYELPIYSAAVMPDHVHLVIALQTQTAEAWVGFFKRAASRSLTAAGLHPFSNRDSNGRLPSPWVAGGWRVYLHTDDEIEHAIKYVKQNPAKAGLPAQNWEFLADFVSCGKRTQG